MSDKTNPSFEDVIALLHHYCSECTANANRCGKDDLRVLGNAAASITCAILSLALAIRDLKQGDTTNE